MTAPNKKVYKTSNKGKPLITSISGACRTPTLEIKFCNLVHPFYYDNSKTVPRYSITCLLDPELHEEFLKGIQTIEKNEGVETVLKNEIQKIDGQMINTGKILIKFQGKEKIPVFAVEKDRREIPLVLEDEFEPGEKVVVIYDIMRYTKKNTVDVQHGINFKPTKIYWYPTEE